MEKTTPQSAQMRGGASPTPVWKPLPSPLVLGRYHLFERLGQRGLVETFIVATEGSEGSVRHLVLKRMRHQAAGVGGAAVNRFIAEARLQSTLMHPNLAPVVAFGMEAGEHFIALEHTRGKRLQSVIRRHQEKVGRPLSVAASYFIVYSMLDALGYLHGKTNERGRRLAITHGDVSPENVIISFHGDVKLTNFKLAAEHQPGRDSSPFLAPERARGEAFDARADLFSTGLVLYSCLTSQPLFGDDATTQPRFVHLDPPILSAFRPSPLIGEPSAELLRKALALDPARRFTTAKAFANKIRSHITAGRTELTALMPRLFPEQSRAAETISRGHGGGATAR